MELCKYAVNAGLNDFNQTAKSSTSLMTESAKTASGNYTVTVSNGSGICGTASLSVEGTEQQISRRLENSLIPSVKTNTAVLSQHNVQPWII